ncbi:MAG: hypoxanthine phosphoribosyltransferase [Anaerolineaceae bacterium]|nr:hypoxanthine phosphoribosyltransferase [Anaerolineaceae bacterium]
MDEVLITSAEIQKRIAELGMQISQDYQDKKILMVCILRGGVIFLTDLIKHISVPVAIEFMAVSSYGTGVRSSSGEVRITLDLNTSITGRDVIIVEDIIDSGHTLSSVIELLETRNPASLCVCSLLDKYERREVDVPLRYCGFKIKDRFVFGFGLDMDEYYRNLPFIGTVDLDRYDPQV